MEACSGAHFFARALASQGHKVRLMPAEYVRPYVKSNKNDFIDAEAIAEAVQRPSMRFVPLKTEEQLDLQALHRVRERWIGRRVALTNQIRGFLLERGLPIRVGSEHLRKALPAVLEGADNGLSARSRRILSSLREQWEELETKIFKVTEEIGRVSRSDEGCKRLMGVPGIGPIIFDRTRCGRRKRNKFPKRSKSGLLAWPCAKTAFFRRQNQTVGHQQAR